MRNDFPQITKGKLLLLLLLILLLLLLLLLSSYPFSIFSFFNNNFSTKMREKQIMILMFCDRTLRKKTE